MTPEQMEQYLSSLTNSQLEDKMKEARRDLYQAAQVQYGSEWHEACFAAVLTFVLEAEKRNYNFTNQED